MSILNTRDLYKRQQELQSELSDMEDGVYDLKKEIEDFDDNADLNDLEELKDQLEDAEEALRGWREEYAEELKELNELETEVDGFMHGVELIPEEDFKQHAMSLVEDTHNQNWPYNCIDWDQATDELMHDYTVISYQGEEYLYRS